MNCMSLAENFIAEMRKKNCSVTVEYHSINGNGVLSGISATLGRTSFRTNDSYGASIISHSKDFIIELKDMDIIPKRGDVIYLNNKRYEVLAPNDEPVWRFSGVNELALRIHTKEVGEVDNE